MTHVFKSFINNNNNTQLLTRRMSAVSGRIARTGSRDIVYE